MTDKTCYACLECRKAMEEAGYSVLPLSRISISKACEICGKKKTTQETRFRKGDKNNAV